jgi:hypothetical protein
MVNVCVTVWRYRRLGSTLFFATFGVRRSFIVSPKAALFLRPNAKFANHFNLATPFKPSTQK